MTQFLVVLAAAVNAARVPLADATVLVDAIRDGRITEADAEGVTAGRLSVADAIAIGTKRARLDACMDESEYRVSRFERDSRKRTSGGNLFTKGMGHRSLGAKAHGKATVCTPGSGRGRYAAERLHRIA